MNKITSDQRRQYNRFTSDGARKALAAVGPDKEGLQRLFARGGEWQVYLEAGVRQFTRKQADYTLVQSILGDNFITAEEIMAARPDVVYSPEQIAQLAGTIPSEAVLSSLRENGYGLMPQPPKTLSLLKVRSARPAHFYSKEGGWYADQKFAKDDVTSTGWLAVKKTPVTGSTNRNWDEQIKLITSAEYVPNAAEVSWFITIFFDVRSTRLFEGFYVRTYSIDSDGHRVFVGDFDARGLIVGGHWGGHCLSDLGLASARKF